MQLHEEGSLIYLHKKQKSERLGGIAYELLSDQIIDTFGASPEYLKIHKAKKELELLHCELLHSGDRSIKFHIDMAEKELEELIAPTQKSNLTEAMIWIRSKGISVNEQTVSIYWFYKYMEFLKKRSQEEIEASRKYAR